MTIASCNKISKVSFLDLIPALQLLPPRIFLLRSDSEWWCRTEGDGSLPDIGAAVRVIN